MSVFACKHACARDPVGTCVRVPVLLNGVHLRSCQNTDTLACLESIQTTKHLVQYTDYTDLLSAMTGIAETMTGLKNAVTSSI